MSAVHSTLDAARLLTDPQVADGRIRPTRRQLQVLHLLADGLETKEIARQLDISFGTAKNHVLALLSLFGARNRAQLVAQAIRRGIIQ